MTGGESIPGFHPRPDRVDLQIRVLDGKRVRQGRSCKTQGPVELQRVTHLFFWTEGDSQMGYWPSLMTAGGIDKGRVRLTGIAIFQGMHIQLINMLGRYQRCSVP